MVGLLQLVGYRFQVLFHSPPGVLFTFPSRYFFTIGHHGVFSLGWWSTRFPTRFPVAGRTQDTPRVTSDFAYGTFTLYDRPSQTFLLPVMNPTSESYNPSGIATSGLGSSNFARRYFRNLVWFILLELRKMVQFSQSRLAILYIHIAMYRHYSIRVAPFGNQRINGCLLLPVAFRSLPRPSSPHGA